MHQAFWAKSAGETQSLFKPVVHHGLDVAACAFRFLETSPTRLARELRLSGLSQDRHLSLCALLAALHDLGKISRSFQALVPALWPEAVLGACPRTPPSGLRHWHATAKLLAAPEVEAALAPVFGPGGLDGQVRAAVAGHHGLAPDEEVLNADSFASVRDPAIGPMCVEAAASACAELVALFDDLRDLPGIADPEGFSFALNGLITLSDWVGSDPARFAFEDPAMPAAQYWPIAQERAAEALAATGLPPARPTAVPSLARLSPHVAMPRPMQTAASVLSIGRDPQIVVIEDGTGSGKTEAALLLAARMIASGLGEGLFVALPTMATANAMHGRLKAALGGVFDGPASLVLAHGKADLAGRLARLAEGVSAGGEGDEMRTWASAWVADNRKKAFLASAGAGTIDQAFLSILPKKHLTLRQYALAGRILIVDEAHTCDAYMGEELKVLVQMQARLGGSVIVLSATLSRSQRGDLLAAFALGRGLRSASAGALRDSLRSQAYPLLSRWCAGEGVSETAVDGAPGLARRVEVRRIGDRAQTVTMALEAAARGAAVGIICNAVDPAIETWRALRDAGQPADRCHLFHARFTMEDRMAIEARVQGWFGRDSTPDRRAGRILVATQVIEQSLDLDFDVLISDLAPVDLLVQRAGRLWRHARSGRPEAVPTLHVLTPEPQGVARADWLDPVLGPAAFVYRMPGVMWRTARDLLAKGALETPDDLRTLIETAYAPEDEDLPPCLRGPHQEMLGTGHGERACGKHAAIDPDAGYAVLCEMSADEEIGTRLGEPSVTLRLARREGATLVPLARHPGADAVTRWALSEVAVRLAWLQRAGGGAVPEPADPGMVEAARAIWPEWEAQLPLYEVDGAGRLATETDVGLAYDGEAGLHIRPA